MTPAPLPPACRLHKPVLSRKIFIRVKRRQIQPDITLARLGNAGLWLPLIRMPLSCVKQRCARDREIDAVHLGGISRSEAYLGVMVSLAQETPDRRLVQSDLAQRFAVHRQHDLGMVERCPHQAGDRLGVRLIHRAEFDDVLLARNASGRSIPVKQSRSEADCQDTGRCHSGPGASHVIHFSAGYVSVIGGHSPVVELSLPSASPALMRSIKTFHSLFFLFEKTFCDRALCGALMAAFNNEEENHYD